MWFGCLVAWLPLDEWYLLEYACCVETYVYICIYDGLPCMCDIILEWHDGYWGSSACEINE